MLRCPYTVGRRPQQPISSCPGSYTVHFNNTSSGYSFAAAVVVHVVIDVVNLLSFFFCYVALIVAFVVVVVVAVVVFMVPKAE